MLSNKEVLELSWMEEGGKLRAKDCFIARKSFFYKSGMDATKYKETIAARLEALGVGLEVLDYGEQWKPFRGGDDTRKGQGSFFWVKFKLLDKHPTTD